MSERVGIEAGGGDLIWGLPVPAFTFHSQILSPIRQVHRKECPLTLTQAFFKRRRVYSCGVECIPDECYATRLVESCDAFVSFEIAMLARVRHIEKKAVNGHVGKRPPDARTDYIIVFVCVRIFRVRCKTGESPETLISD